MDTYILCLLTMAAILGLGGGSSSSSSSSKQGLEELNLIGTAKSLVWEARAYYYSAHQQLLLQQADQYHPRRLLAFGDCAKLYDEAEPRLHVLLAHGAGSSGDAGIWVSAVLTSHRTCLDGLEDASVFELQHHMSLNLTCVLTDALAFYANNNNPNPIHPLGSIQGGKEEPVQDDAFGGLLKWWDPAKSKADMVVATDGSGTHRSINAAVDALTTSHPTKRQIVYIKAGVYDERVVIHKGLKNLMFVGDGIDKTVVTGRRNYMDGHTTISSSTFDVSGDGFWARDITFENTAGPEKHQAVAIRVNSDHSLFYRCSFRGYQDTLYAYSLRQFYRDCLIQGTVDFIFGNAAAVLQNCDLLVLRPLPHQSNMVTAHSRDKPHDPTGFSIQGSRIRPGPDLDPVVGSFKTFLGRPWRRYARVVVWRSELDGMIDPRGWTEWDGGFGLVTLFYAEYMNLGAGEETRRRVRWPGYHVLSNDRDVRPFTVKDFIDGDRWIPGSGVPVLMDV